MLNIRERIDPDGTLPVVEVRPVGDRDFSTYDIVYGNTVVGNCWLPMHDSTVCFEAIKLTTRPVKGIGLSVYVWAIEKALKEGRNFCNDSSITESAVKIWRILAAASVAEVVEEFQFVRLNDTGESLYEGEYLVTATATSTG